MLFYVQEFVDARNEILAPAPNFGVVLDPVSGW